jgi:MFS transporter, UMF1 family
MSPLRHLYPLRGLPKQGQIWSWISFDVANQSFTLIINTLLFSIFFQQVAAANVSTKNTWWSGVFAVSMLLVVLASPIAGAMADGRSCRKQWLLGTGLLCAAMTCALGLIPAGGLWIAILLYVPANFAFNIGENFLASFLPQLARREDFGKVSGFSWGTAYSAALVMLVLVAWIMKARGMTAPESWRPFFVAAGVWFFVFCMPTLLFLKEAKGPISQENPLRTGFTRLARTLREVGKFRDLAILLAASLCYGAGMNIVIAFASLIASDFGFDDVQLVLFVAVITVSGIVGTLIPTFLQDRVGHKRMTLGLLGVWVFTTCYLALIAWKHAQVPPGAPSAQWPVWVAGNLLGLGIGSLGSANRAFVGYLTPPSRSAEFFGIWGLVFKLAAVGVVPFGIVKDHLGLPASLLVLAIFIIAGFVITLFVDEHRGMNSAREEPPTAPDAKAA